MPQILAVHDKEAEDEGEEDDARIVTAKGKPKVTKQGECGATTSSYFTVLITKNCVTFHALIV